MKKQVIKSTVQGKCAPKFRHRWELIGEMGDHKVYLCGNCGGKYWRISSAFGASVSRDSRNRSEKPVVKFVPLDA